MESWIVVGIIVLLLYIYSIRKDTQKTKTAIVRSAKFVVKSLPLFFLAVLLIGFMQVVLLPDSAAINTAFGDPDFGIFNATVLGFLLPGPRYAIYPLAQTILVGGGTTGAVMALIASQQLIDVPEGCFIEVKYLGWRFFGVRLILAIMTSFLAGYLALLVNIYFPLYTP